MKFKKQYRWLLFLSIPFIFFMFVLFLTPLEFVLNAQPLATQTYSIQKIQNQQRSVRTNAFSASKTVNNYFEIINQLIKLYSTNPSESFFSTNINSITINTAYDYSQNASMNSSMKQSMWFAKGINDIVNLSASQKTIYGQYIKNQVKIRSYFNKKDDFIDTVAGVYNFYQDNNSASNIIFYFPSYQQSNYSRLNYTIDRTIYQNLLNSYRANNNTYMFLGNISRQGFTENIVSLCRLRIQQNITNGYTCLDIDALKLNQLGMISDIPNDTENAYLLSPAYFSTLGGRIIYNISSTLNSSHPNYEEQKAILSSLISYLPLAEQSSMTISKNNRTSYYLYGLSLWDDSTQSQNTFAYYLIQSYHNYNSKDIQSADVVNKSLNTLLIPTIILICLSLIISVIILRSLMNGLDLELHRLNQSCKFIFDGDLDIEIPDFKGTKDINEVYEEVKIINKLHRYTNKDYFVGHFSNRIFKYNQALQVIKKLNYDPSNLMQNIGQAYIYIEEYDKSIYYLKQSIKYVEKKIDLQFGGLDRMVIWKQEKEKIPSAYREMELILIRRLWKIVFCLFKYVQLQIMNSKQLDQQNLTEKQKQLKKQRLQKQTLDCISKLKKAMYPDFKSYAEACMLLNFQIKFFISIKNIQGAKDCLSRCSKITEAYGKQYDAITKKLKQKGSKNLLFFRRNKLSGHSRASPLIMESFFQYTKGVLSINDPTDKDYYKSICGFFQGFKKNLFSQSVNFLLVNEIKKHFATLKVSFQKFTATQLFRQSMPYKTLHCGPISKQIQPTLYRLPKNPAEVECREYVITLDGSYYYSTEKQLTDQLKYLKERSEYLYDKLIKKFDRISLIQANSRIGMETLCNLTLKQYNETILRKSLIDMVNYKSFDGRNELLGSLEKIIFRIKNLQCEKIIVMLLKYIQSYIDQRVYKGKSKERFKSKKKTLQFSKKTQQIDKSGFIQQIGEGIQELMSTQGLRNCKLLLMCATTDEYSRLIKVFGLKDINRRIWSHMGEQGLNINNNVVYIIDEKHKSDLDRILMSKLASVSDNHVFAL